MTYDITLIPGDGIGPEITDATLKVLDATGVRVHLGPAAGWCRCGRRERRSAAGRDAREHPSHAPGTQGPADHTGRRRIPVSERGIAEGIRVVRQRAAGQDDRAGRTLRRHRHRAGARKSRGVVRGAGALGGARRRSAWPGRVGGCGDPARLGARHPLRIRLRAQARAQAGHPGPQGEHPQAHVGTLSRGRPGDRRGIRGARDDERADHRQLRDATGDAS